MKLAEKAKQAAAELDQQLNESVGVANTTNASSSEPILEEALWDDDDDDHEHEKFSNVVVVDDDENEIAMEPLDEEDEWQEDDGDLFDGDTSVREDEAEKVEEQNRGPVEETVDSKAEGSEVAAEPTSDPQPLVQDLRCLSSVATEEKVPTLSPNTIENGESTTQEKVHEAGLPDNAAAGPNQIIVEEEATHPPSEGKSAETQAIVPSASADQSEPTKSCDTEEASVAPIPETQGPLEPVEAEQNAETSFQDEQEMPNNDEARRQEAPMAKPNISTVEESRQPVKQATTQKSAPSVNNTKLICQLQSQLAASRQQRDNDRAKFTQRLAAAQQQTKQATETADALRQEGERLAKSQSVMESAVRKAKGELRGVQTELEQTNAVCEEQKMKILSLEDSISALTADLETASSTASTATKLQSELSECKAESERRANNILNLEQQLKELKFMVRDVSLQLDTTQQESASETATVQKQLRQQHATTIAELQQQFEVASREAAEREDDLRGQVDTLRTKWQDAIRRADALAVENAAQSTPRMMQQQLESTNQQYRARAAAAAALEEELRCELDETKKSIENLSSELEQYKTKATELNSTYQSQTTEIVELRRKWKEQSEAATSMETELVALREDVTRLRNELKDAERQAETCGVRVRGEMSQSLIDSEKRHVFQLQSLEAELRNERTERRELQEELEAVKLHHSNSNVAVNGTSVVAESKSKPQPKLRRSEGQAAILAGALGGFGSEHDEDIEEEDDKLLDDTTTNGGSSYAALEELSSRWRSAKAELDTLRKRLDTSEATRQELLDRVAESRDARERLPVLETELSELSAENRELSLEVQGLRADIVDVQELYRSQLNSLLEAQASTQAKGNSEVDGDTPPADSAPEEQTVQPEI